MTEVAGSLEYRLLRRSDVPSYLTVVLQGIGKLERSTGLDRGAEKMVRSLSRRSIWTVLRLSQLLGRSFARIFVAVDGNRVVGTGTLLRLPNAAYVAGMATDAGYRGRGIASQVLTLLQKDAARRHQEWLVLDVDSDNDTAIRVYRRAGYREAARFTWYVRTGVPPTLTPLPPRTRPATREELNEIAPKLDEGRAADYRAALPSTRRRLSHNEVLSGSFRSRKQTWVLWTLSGPPLALRVSCAHSREAPMAVYLPLVGSTPPTLEEATALLDRGTEWLRPQAPATCLAVVAEPTGAVGVALERLGFKGVASSMTMVRSSST
jgi:ribosomal protein S18 acetylase RimI-like enzyme